MNEEEAELLPPYLRPYPPSGAPLGTLSYNRRSKCRVVTVSYTHLTLPTRVAV